MIDATIPLNVRPPEVVNPLDQFNKIQGIRNTIANTQLHQQEAEQNRVKAQREQQQYDQAQRDLDAQNTEGELIAANTQAAPDGSTQVNHGAVVQGLAAKGYGSQAATYKTRVQLPDDKARIENQKNQLENAQKQLGITSNYIASVLNTPDEQLPQAYDQAVQEITQKGITKPGQLPPAQDVMAQGGVTGLRQFVQQHAAQATAADQQATAHRADLDYALRLNEFHQKVLTESPDTAGKWTKQASSVLSAATTPEQYATGLQTLRGSGAPDAVLAQFDPQFSPDAVKRAARMGMTAKEAADAILADKRDAEAARHNVATEKTGAGELAVKQQEAALQARKFALEMGGDAVKGWAETIKQNPDAVSSVPPALRTAVQQEFTRSTGLPLPKPLTGQAVDQERGARSVMETLRQINEDAQDPEIQSRLGPILGRLGNAEQAVGTAVGLSPSAEAKAQRLRTNMRYMVFGEGKTLMGGRLPQNLMKALEESSPSVKMDVPTLNGAMSGVQDAALRSLDTADQQRFGGKMRSREDRGITPVNIGAAPSKYKAGDTRVINGVTYTRDDQGNWK